MLVMIDSMHQMNLHNEANLLGWAHGWALKNLSREVGRERYKLAGDEIVLVVVLLWVQRRSVEQSSQVESGEYIENNDLMRSISVN